MRCIRCGSYGMVYVGKDTWVCPICHSAKIEPELSNNAYDSYQKRRQTPYERTRAAVYATGNKWAIENFNATH